MSIVLSKDQETAVQLILNEKIGIVTGPPGSGKSTITGVALSKLSGVTVCLCAPTGKAAKRLSEVTKFPAATIHRTLGAKRGSVGWDYDEKNPLPHQLVIVDEASMIDTFLMSALLNAINPHTTRLILIGDADQLPSVGPGRVFAELIESETVPSVRLTTVHRAAETTWVYRVAPKILRGVWEHAKGDPGYKPAWISDANEARQALVDIVVERMKRAGIQDFQVMSPMYDGPVGVSALNNALQDALNPVRYEAGEPETSLVFRDRGKDVHIRPRDQVIQIVNDYNRAVFNGETGVVKRVDGLGVKVDFGDREIEYDLQDAKAALRLSYAITVHRFQGSEAKWAVVVCHSTHARMWNRQLLYTAVTRAREGVVVVGDRTGLNLALSTDDPLHRISFLTERLVRLESVSEEAMKSEEFRSLLSDPGDLDTEA
jgi:exodeoxyribonuclease V alpha subunit